MTSGEVFDHALLAGHLGVADACLEVRCAAFSFLELSPCIPSAMLQAVEELGEVLRWVVACETEVFGRRHLCVLVYSFL